MMRVNHMRYHVPRMGGAQSSSSSVNGEGARSEDRGGRSNGDDSFGSAPFVRMLGGRGCIGGGVDNLRSANVSSGVAIM
jgi:hypothetical protein